MLTRCGLTNPELVGDEQAADAIFDEIAVDLRREVLLRGLEPIHDVEPSLVCKSLHDLRSNHVVSLPFDESLCQHTTAMQHAETVVDGPAIARTYVVIRPHIRLTPVMDVDGKDFSLGGFPLTLKLEQLQHAGSFKARGAFANLLLRSSPPAGVVAASGGNHGAAVAYAAQQLQVPAHIFVPTVSSPPKIDRIRSCGARLTMVGDRYDDALAASQQWAGVAGARTIHAFDQVETLLGQGTLGLECAAQMPALDTLLVAVGGGGLIGGVAAWFEGRVRVIGVEPVGAPTLTAALEAGAPVDAPAGGIAADSLAPRRVGVMALAIAQRCVERVVLVRDGEIVRAQQSLWETLRIVAEPGGAAAFAALLSRAYVPEEGERVGVVISGGNSTAVQIPSATRP
jgi:threonine dehydratase